MNRWPTVLLGIAGFLGLGFVFGVALVDAWLGGRNQPTIAERIQPWTKRNPWFAGALAFGLGALITHFFWPGG